MIRYGYRLERMEKMTDPLKRIELFKAVTSPAYIIATLENVNDVSSDFFCPVKKCFEFACEASAKAKATPEYKREYQEIEQRLVWLNSMPGMHDDVTGSIQSTPSGQCASVNQGGCVCVCVLSYLVGLAL